MTNVFLLIFAVFVFAYIAQYCKRQAVTAGIAPYNKNNESGKGFAPLFFVLVVFLLILFSSFRTRYNDT
ncbi:MAG: hypothetical protein K2H13_10140, partial [Eubacterium sp.]|nr:hypothetical protein [Eubacterium sp.]